ncbi:hypothetical protein J3B02_000801 [Coemansia erecta]|nr:hypothetical protein J3B02_000801 [Coemansia erecta]KAJ2875085.1 hypothetical protein FB639_004035 [Coemansia asiatica]
MVVRLVISRYNGKKIVVNSQTTIKISKLKELIQGQLDVPAENQHLYHNKTELSDIESIGHSERKKKHNIKRPIKLQLLVQSMVNVKIEKMQIKLLTSDICTVGQIKAAVCREHGWRASCYAVFNGARKADEKMRMGDWLVHGDRQIRIRKLPLHRFVAWSWQCVKDRIGGNSQSAAV